MSSGDPLVFFSCSCNFPTSPHSCFLFSFFSSDSQLFIVFYCICLRVFFLFVFFSISLVFFIPRVIVLIFHYLFSYICQLSAINITIYHALRR